MINPFTPGFGHDPYVVMGREQCLEEYDHILNTAQPGHQDLYPLISGNRGVGKTVLLHEYEELLKQRHFFIFSNVLGPSSYADIVRAITGSSNKNTRKRTRKEFSPSVSVANGDTSYTIGGFTFETEKEAELFDIDLGEALRKKAASPKYAGVAIILDELNMKYIDDLRRLIVTVQAAANDNNNVIMIAAGVDENIDALENDITVSFTRRMNRKNIGSIDIDVAKDGIYQTLKDHEMDITDEALTLIAEASDGYPFIIQRIASDSWDAAYNRDSKHINITVEDFRKAAPTSTAKIYCSIVQPAIRSLSAVDMEFLTAMATYDDNVVPISYIEQKLGKTKAYIGKYRQRLIKQHIIEKDTYGSVYCILPYLMLYLSNEEEAKMLCSQLNTTVMKESKSKNIMRSILSNTTR